ncbi:MAG: FtsH protease activity modulator HflK [Gammaproteobacteria bacterium]
MAWNEPGGRRDKDPWGGRGNGGGPPDLDEAFRKLRAKIKGLFGERGPISGGGGGGGGGGSPALWILALVVLVALAIYESVHVIAAAERAVVMRFGAYITTLMPGLNFRWPPPIERVEKVNIDQIRSVGYKAAMYTQDENIVDVELNVQYRVKSIEDFAFNVVGPDATLEQVTESSVRGVIGENKMDFIVTEGRTQVVADIRKAVQELLDQYQSGLEVTSVNMQPAKPPEEVKSAFDDAIKAREDEQRFINEAKAYVSLVLPKAEGQAARIRADAEGYRSRVIAHSEGEASRFTQILTEYEKAPEVTRERLYLETVESVLSNSPKVLLDVQGGNNLIYLPLDKLFAHTPGSQEAAEVPPRSSSASGAEPEPLASDQAPVPRADGRSRERGETR